MWLFKEEDTESAEGESVEASAGAGATSASSPAVKNLRHDPALVPSLSAIGTSIWGAVKQEQDDARQHEQEVQHTMEGASASRVKVKTSTSTSSIVSLIEKVEASVVRSNVFSGQNQNDSDEKPDSTTLDDESPIHAAPAPMNYIHLLNDNESKSAGTAQNHTGNVSEQNQTGRAGPGSSTSSEQALQTSNHNVSSSAPSEAPTTERALLNAADTNELALLQPKSPGALMLLVVGAIVFFVAGVTLLGYCAARDRIFTGGTLSGGGGGHGDPAAGAAARSGGGTGGLELFEDEEINGDHALQLGVTGGQTQRSKNSDPRARNQNSPPEAGGDRGLYNSLTSSGREIQRFNEQQHVAPTSDQITAQLESRTTLPDSRLTVDASLTTPELAASSVALVSAGAGGEEDYPSQFAGFGVLPPVVPASAATIQLNKYGRVVDKINEKPTTATAGSARNSPSARVVEEVGPVGVAPAPETGTVTAVTTGNRHKPRPPEEQVVSHIKLLQSKKGASSSTLQARGHQHTKKAAKPTKRKTPDLHAKSTSKVALGGDFHGGEAEIIHNMYQSVAKALIRSPSAASSHKSSVSGKSSASSARSASSRGSRPSAGLALPSRAHASEKKSSNSSGTRNASRGSTRPSAGPAVPRP
ncbi:unnamed protein product [Amoebophrya sp. A120]|nr:unnamed protein product [Amoebophrya sp. A120]|eukprot:GSA120T00012399001.1